MRVRPLSLMHFRRSGGGRHLLAASSVPIVVVGVPLTDVACWCGLMHRSSVGVAPNSPGVALGPKRAAGVAGIANWTSSPRSVRSRSITSVGSSADTGTRFAPPACTH